MKVKDYPIIKTIVLISIGFFLAYHLKIELSLVLIFIVISFLITILTYRNKQFLSSISVVLLLISFGYLIFYLSYYDNEKERKLFEALNNKKILMYGRVKKVDYFDEDKIQFTFNAEKIVFERKWASVNQNFLVNLSLKDNSLSLNYFDKLISPGNEIRISGNISIPTEPKFPGEFNNKLYLKSKGINFILNSTIYDELNLINENKSLLNFSRYLNKLRQKIKFQIEENFEPLTAAYIKGLFIAERSDIPEEIKEDFVHSGVIHVLAVSGLHTGYIALILIALTGRFRKWLRVILVALGLYVFAHLANLSPSVIRASIMSVVVLISLMVERKNQILNSIALAALLILLFNPLDVFNPGFQLSFSAVISIALIYPTLTKTFGLTNLVGMKKYIVDLLFISIAVSIGTFPFVASYYQKFSFIALIANLFIIPLTGIILGGIILNLLILNIFPFVFPLYKVALTEVINFNFMVVKFFANLPFAYTSIKNFSTANAIVYFLMIGLILIFLNKNFRPLTKIVIVSLLVFNYSFYFKILSNDLINSKDGNLLLLKLNGANSIFMGDLHNNFIKIFGKSSIQKTNEDMKKIDKILWSLNYENVKLGSITTPSIWINHDLRNRLNKTSVSQISDGIWIFSEKKFNDINKFIARDSDYIFLKNSYTEVFNYNGWLLIVSPVEFEKVKAKLVSRVKNFIYVKPDLDTIRVNTNSNKIQTFLFNNDLIKIFELKTDSLSEISWRNK